MEAFFKPISLRMLCGQYPFLDSLTSLAHYLITKDALLARGLDIAGRHFQLQWKLTKLEDSQRKIYPLGPSHKEAMHAVVCMTGSSAPMEAVAVMEAWKPAGHIFPVHNAWSLVFQS